MKKTLDRLNSLQNLGNVDSSHEGALSASNERILIRALIDQIPDFLFVKDVHGRFIIANKAIAAAYGTTTEALVGKTDFDLHPEDRARGFFELEQQVIGQGKPLFDLEETFPNSHGVQRFYATTKIPLLGHNDEIVGLVGVARDVTDRRHAETLVLQQNLILELIAQDAPLNSVLDRLVLLVETQLPGIQALISVAESGGEGSGRSQSAGGLTSDRAPQHSASDLSRDSWSAAPGGLAEAADLRSCWSTPILAQGGFVLGTFSLHAREMRELLEAEVLMIDMAVRLAGIAIQRSRSEDRIRFMAHHDALTGLPNRALLNDQLRQAMHKADVDGSSIFVAFIDLDNFKMVNDALGHVTGDALLRTVAERMRGCLRSRDAVVRLGGDEFVVLLQDSVDNRDDVVSILQRVKAAIGDSIDIQGRHLQVTASIGVAVYPENGNTVESLLKNADAAMYSAKSDGRDRLRFYTPAMNAEVLERMHLQEELRHAIERGELTLVYQPQVDLRTLRVFGVEALLRWTHGRLGEISPAKFIPIAESSGLIVAIGEWVLKTACTQSAAWCASGLPPVTMAVNVSARQFRERDFAGRVETVLVASGLPPALLELELTETMLMYDLASAVETMRELNEVGVRLSVDDFGTGYSSLNALKRFPVCRLKIDKSFVHDLPGDENDCAITAAVISLGQSMGLRVIAEGVETQGQLAFLLENNCDEMQGFLFSKPLDAAGIERLLRDQAETENKTPLKREAA